MKRIKLALIFKTIFIIFGTIDAKSVENNFNYLRQDQGQEQNFELCEPPPCNTEDQRNKLWPTPDKTQFYQCVPDPSCGYKALERPCAPGTVFGYYEQVCIWERDWVDPCGGNSTTQAPPSTTSKPSSTTTRRSTTRRSTTKSSTTTTSTQQPTTTSSSTTTTEEAPEPTELCSAPNCTINERHQLWPVRDAPESFYRCEPDREVDCKWNVVEDNCPQGKYFDYNKQECVDPEDWNDVCNEEEPSSTTASTTTTSSTTASTTTTTTEETTEDPDDDLCEEPKCTDDQTHRLWPSYEGPDKYWQCIPQEGGVWEAELRTCDQGTTFSYENQTCSTGPFEDVCGGLTPPTEAQEQSQEQEEKEEEDLHPQQCPIPDCSQEEEQRKLHPSFDPRFYYICTESQNGNYKPVIMPCPKGLYFKARNQSCVEPCDWEYSCGSYTNVTTTTLPPVTTESVTEVNEEEETTTSTTTEKTTEAPVETTTQPEETTTTTTEAPTTTTTEQQTTTTEQQTTTTEQQTTTTEQQTTTTEQQTTTTEQQTTEAPTTTTTEEMTTESTTTTTEPTTTTDQSTTEQSTEPTTTEMPTGCEEPKCKANDTMLYPHEDPTKYYQCAPANGCEWKPVVKECPRPLYFGFKQQNCVWCNEYENVCNSTFTTTMSPSTTDAVTEVTDTETEPTTRTSTTTTTARPTTRSTTRRSTTRRSTTRQTTTTTQKPESTTAALENPTSCGPPMCKANETTLYPHEDPTKFYQCAPASNTEWKPVVKQCPQPLYFGFKQQVCVWCEDFENVCNSTTSSTTESASQVTEEEEKEEEPSSTTSTTTTQRSTTRRSTTRRTTPKTTRQTTSSTTTERSTSGPSSGNCGPPTCSANDTTLYPHEDPTKFYQCAPASNTEWKPVVQQCPQPLYFGFKQQVCVWCDDYENVCNSTSSGEGSSQQSTTLSPQTTRRTTTRRTTRRTTTSRTTRQPTTTTTARTTTEAYYPEESGQESSSDFCVTPSCKTDLQKNKLWAHPDRNLYYQCAPMSNGMWEPVERPCNPGTVFHYKLQVCVWESDWEDPCAGNAARKAIPPPVKPKKGYFYPKKYHQWNY
ncbi:mucin-5AC-like [Culicoides brevitarsis]|uniref:mucin-5AC-like n=1 Tax=Culicoides brevitarsis TaxID=469753 RepID=UPI00307C8E07